MQSANGVSGSVLAEADARWSDLRKRVASALVLVPLAIGCLWWGGVPFVLIVCCAALGMGREWAMLCHGGVWRLPGAILALSLLAVAVLTGIGLPLAALAALGIAGAALCWSGRVFAFGAPYIGVAVIAMIWLRADPVAGFSNVLFLLLIVWASDIGAYVVGRLCGGRKLAPAISPGKTWSGAGGGLIAAIAAAGIVAICLDPAASIWRAGLLGAILGVTAQVGDLFESGIKRYFGVKDSGQSIPGHGGLLDRLDAVLLAAPVAAMLALSAGRGAMVWE